MTERLHGYARYKLDGCRCYPCCYAVSEYNDHRERAIAYGTWQPWTDAEPARAHVRELQACGLGTRRIANLAGLDRKSVIGLLNGRPDRGTPPSSQIRPATAAALLAVEPTLDNLGSATLIDVTGTRRRLQALIFAGWPQHHLAVRLGLRDTTFSSLLRLDRTTVRTARATRDLYDQLWRANPLEHGVLLQGRNRARNHAASWGWAPVGAWDDDTIDNPAATPDIGGDHKLTRDELGAARREEILHLASFGTPDHDIAARVGLDTKYVHDQITGQHIRRNRKPQPAVAS